MAARRSGLGRGLDALISDKVGTKNVQTASESEKNTKKKSGKNAKTSKSKSAKKKDTSSKILSVEEGEKKDRSVDSAYNKEETDHLTEQKLENEVSDHDPENASVIEENSEAEKHESAEIEADTGKITTDYEENHVIDEPDNSDDITENPADSSEKSHEFAQYDSEENHMENTISSENTGDESVVEMKISLVEPNREQPRKTFNDETIQELADSVRQYGIIQPLLVQKADGYYQIIAGERRWRAARKAGLKTVPVIIKDFSTQTAVEVSLIENIQREDLNPMEEAKAYERLVKDYDLTQEEVAEKVSKNRSTVTNSMRLLKLSSEVQNYVADGSVTEGHARALLGISDPEVQKQIADQIIQNHLNVRETEKIVRSLSVGKKRKRSNQDAAREAVLNSLSEQLKNVFGTKVAIHQGRKNRGKIEIEYYSEEELDRIFEMLSSVRG